VISSALELPARLTLGPIMIVEHVPSGLGALLARQARWRSGSSALFTRPIFGA
jgi:hypothetical protein